MEETKKQFFLSPFARGQVRRFFGQATKGLRWMTWHEKAMKDAVSSEMLR